VTDSDAGNATASVRDVVSHVDDSSAIVRADVAETGSLGPEVLRRRWELVLPYRDEMLKVARRRLDTREDAEDVVATSLMRTVEHPRLDEARVGPFLCTTVMRLAVDVHRDRARQLAVGKRDAARALPAGSIDELVCDEAEARWLAAQLQDLPERERQVLQARLSGLTAQQASEHLGLTLKATENAYTRVRQRAQRVLAATLAGIGILLGAGRRLNKPELALVPVGVATALTLAVVVSNAPSPAPPPRSGVMLEADTEPVEAVNAVENTDQGATPARVVAPVAPTSEPSTATGQRKTGPSVDAVSEPSPTRTEGTAPPVVEDHLGPGTVYVEDRHADESFEDSVRRCADGVTAADPVADPMADPCH
jgi:RNA polymerase sigma factor (sigma-70 family)